MRAYADLFKRGADRRPDDLERAMAGISRESARMTMLVEDLLLLARLDEGLPLERRRVELADLVGDGPDQHPLHAGVSKGDQPFRHRLGRPDREPGAQLVL